MNAQEFEAKHMEDGEVFDAECVYDGDDIVEHKMVYQTSVYKIGDQYFEVTNSRDNSGYWSDGERYNPEVREVKPREEIVKVVRWDAV